MLKENVLVTHGTTALIKKNDCNVFLTASEYDLLSHESYLFLTVELLMIGIISKDIINLNVALKEKES